MDTAPSLFSQPEPSLSYAKATCAKERDNAAYDQAMREEEAEMA